MANGLTLKNILARLEIDMEKLSEKDKLILDKRTFVKDVYDDVSEIYDANIDDDGDLIISVD